MANIKIITKEEELSAYTYKKRIWQGIPSIEVTEKGKMFVAFYSGGTKEEIGNYILLFSCAADEFSNAEMKEAGDYGKLAAVIKTDENHRCYDPCLWIDPLKRLWFIFACAPNRKAYASIIENPDSEKLKFSEIFEIGKEVMMNKPTILKSGEWLFPIAEWSYLNESNNVVDHTKTGAYVYRSTDMGKSFEVCGVAHVDDHSYHEHMIVELNDGRLAMFVRTLYGIGVSYSSDKGKSWTAGRDSGLGGPSSRFHIRRLESGNLLLINHYKCRGRNNLCAMISDDELNTWPYVLMLDERDNVSYPDVSVRGEYIYIVYDRERGGFMKSLDEVYSSAREILIAKVTEKDILSGKLVSKGSYLKKVFSKLGKFEGEELKFN